MTRLDIFLVSDDWEDHFGNVTQTILPKPLSNHFPILLVEGGNTAKGPTPVWFEDMWLKAKGFKDRIAEWWESFVFRGTSSFVMAEKLKALKHKLKSWNKEVFRRVEDSFVEFGTLGCSRTPKISNPT